MLQHFTKQNKCSQVTILLFVFSAFCFHSTSFWPYVYHSFSLICLTLTRLPFHYSHTSYHSPGCPNILSQSWLAINTHTHNFMPISFDCPSHCNSITGHIMQTVHISCIPCWGVGKRWPPLRINPYQSAWLK